MLISKTRHVLAGAFISLLLVSGCGDSSKPSTAALVSEEGVLQFVPADTPYLIATPGQIPDDVMDKVEPQVDAVLRAYHRIIQALAEDAYAEAREEDGDVESFERLLPVIEQLGELMSVEGLRKAGIVRESKMALYGNGLLPVLRLSLSDGKLLNAEFARLEEKAGQQMSVATIDGQTYRYAGDDDGRVIVAVIDNYLVAAMVPTSLSDEQMKQVLGLTLPASNIAASGVLGTIARTYGFSDYMIGFADLNRLAATFLDQQSGINAELLALMQYDHDELSPVCKSEIRAMAGVMPRIVMGYTELNVERMTSKAVFELRKDLAAGVATLTGAVPGIAADHGGLFSFGMSMDLLAARKFYSDRLDALEAKPYECELFADLQDAVAGGREILDQPVPPIVYGFKGFLAVVEEIEGMDLANDRPPTAVDMRMLLATDNAEGLLAMGAMFSPEIAALNLEPNGAAVKLDLPQLAASGQVVHIAMSDKALGLSVGEGMEAGLPKMLAAPVAERSPFMVFEMDGATYYGFIGDAMAEEQGELHARPEVQEAIQTMTRGLQEMLQRIKFDIYFTDLGIEMETEVTLSD